MTTTGEIISVKIGQMNAQKWGKERTKILKKTWIESVIPGQYQAI